MMMSDWPLFSGEIYVLGFKSLLALLVRRIKVCFMADYSTKRDKKVGDFKQASHNNSHLCLFTLVLAFGSDNEIAILAFQPSRLNSQLINLMKRKNLRKFMNRRSRANKS